MHTDDCILLLTSSMPKRKKAMMNSAGMVAQWFHEPPSCPHSARGSRARKIVRKRAATIQVEAAAYSLVVLLAPTLYGPGGWAGVECVSRN